MPACEIFALFGHQRGNLIRLHGQDQNVGRLHYVRVGLCCPGVNFFGENFPRCIVRIAGNDISRADEFGTDKAARQRRGHSARAEKTDGKFGRHARFVAGNAGKRKWNSQLEFA